MVQRSQIYVPKYKRPSHMNDRIKVMGSLSEGHSTEVTVQGHGLKIIALTSLYTGH